MRMAYKVAAIVITSTLSGVAMSKTLYGPAGCGLGSVIMGHKPGFMQWFASTSNNTLWNQSSGITSGTSNCVASGKDNFAMQEKKLFMASNYAVIEKEMSQGEGETLNALAGMFGCPSDKQDRFNSVTKENHDTIFAAPGASAALERTAQILKADTDLNSSCKDNQG